MEEEKPYELTKENDFALAFIDAMDKGKITEDHINTLSLRNEPSPIEMLVTRKKNK